MRNTIDETEWRACQGYEGVFEVSNTARVRVVGSHVERTATPCRDGYIRFQLRLPGAKQKLLAAHRLVAMAFVPNPRGLECVNHIDGDKKNNHASNLEWVTFKENLSHAQRLGLTHAGIRRGKARRSLKEAAGGSLTESVVIKIIAEHQSGHAQASIARRYGVVNQHVSRIVNQQAWKRLQWDVFGQPCWAIEPIAPTSC